MYVCLLNPIDLTQQMLNNLNEVERLPNFQQLGIDEQRVRKLKEQGIAVPTPVQQESIPAGRKDVIARAKTGTGKTLAFIADSRSILSGRTRRRSLLRRRELALQITEEAKS